jgi:hypothetical protein
MVLSTPNVPSIISDQLCVVFDSDTGNILHMHRVATLEGADTVSEESISATALDYAKTNLSTRYSGSMDTTIVDPDQLEPNMHYKVDLDSRRLIQVPRTKAT